MSDHLAPDLSYCLIDGHPVFLDIESDRYFRLSHALEQVFLAYTRGTLLPDSDRDKLAGCGIVATGSRDISLVPAAPVALPTESAMEQAAPYRPEKTNAALDVLGTVCSTWLRLRRHSLKSNLIAMRAHRDNHAKAASLALSPVLRERFCNAATAFQNARLYVPVPTCCLHDSIAMVRFLARRGLFAHLVFGIMANPLSAHCWVQAGHLVLNDTVGNTRAHTPIRVI